MKESGTMKKGLRIAALLVAIAVAVGVVYSGRVLAYFQHDHSSHEAKAEKVVYTCPMHPEVQEDKPGKCPKCGMELVPKKVADKPKPADKQKKKEDKADPHAGHDTSKMEAPAPVAASQHAGHTAPAASAAPSGQRKILYWYDPMHPAYKSDKPGKAPDCGMELVPKYEDNGSAMNMAPGTVQIPADKQQLMGVRTAKVERQRLERTVRTSGQVTPDETRIAHVHVKVPGYVEQVFVDYVGQTVKKGQPMFTLYSPDLVSTQEEYLIAKRGQNYLSTSPFKEVSDGANSLLRSARERLKLWDISDEQIKKLDETGQATRTLTFYSPISGIVQDRKAFPHTSVNPDTELYTLVDLSSVWVTADVYEFEVPYVREGQRAEMTLSYYPGKSYSGRVKFIQPAVDPMTRTVKVRLEFPNPELKLKPQMFADVQLKIDYGTQVIVPQEAVLDSGNEQVVFVAKDGGYFEPRHIRKGPQMGGKVAVIFGLKPGETIVTSGNFLIDSESRLSSATGGEHQH